MRLLHYIARKAGKLMATGTFPFYMLGTDTQKAIKRLYTEGEWPELNSHMALQDAAWMYFRLQALPDGKYFFPEGKLYTMMTIKSMLESEATRETALVARNGNVSIRTAKAVTTAVNTLSTAMLTASKIVGDVKSAVGSPISQKQQVATVELPDVVCDTDDTEI